MRNSESSVTSYTNRMVETFVRSRVRKNPFLHNFESVVATEGKRKKKITEQMIIDILRPDSEVSFILYMGLPGSGKTTLADSVAETVSDASLGLIAVKRWSFSDYRARAIEQWLSKGIQPTKDQETETATQMMTQDALRIMDEGPRTEDGRRRVIIAEMPVYPVDRRKRGLELVEAIGEKERGVSYEKRRSRVCGVKPDLDVIHNGIVTRLMKLSSGGSPDMLMDIAYKAYAGAYLFGATQPKLYKLFTELVRDPHLRIPFMRHDSLVEELSNVIAVRMLLILTNAELYGPLDTLVKNPSRPSLTSLSRRVRQKNMHD